MPKISKFWLLIILLVGLLGLCLPHQPAIAAITTNPTGYEITVSTTIGEPKLTVFGYTSPQAKVQLQGQRVWEQTTANNQGYFFFDRVFLPRANPHYPELCLSSIDSQKLITFPTCLPALPQQWPGPFEITIGPILLAPTISLEKGQAQGLTIPETEVTIFLNHEAISIRDRKFSDRNGHFEFNLPRQLPGSWRIFAGTTFLGAPSPKSNTLTFKVLKPWEWGWQQLLACLKQLFRLFKPYWWVLIIFLEILLIAVCLKKVYSLPKTDSRSLR